MKSPMTAHRRLPSVIAGCLAIAASLTTMGVIVVSDIAEARKSAGLSDELPEVEQVKMTPRRVQVIELQDPFDSEEAMKAASGIFKPSSKKRRLDFGAFEGY